LVGKFLTEKALGFDNPGATSSRGTLNRLALCFAQAALLPPACSYKEDVCVRPSCDLHEKPGPPEAFVKYGNKALVKGRKSAILGREAYWSTTSGLEGLLSTTSGCQRCGATPGASTWSGHYSVKLQAYRRKCCRLGDRCPGLLLLFPLDCACGGGALGGGALGGGRLVRGDGLSGKVVLMLHTVGAGVAKAGSSAVKTDSGSCRKGAIKAGSGS